MEEEEKGIGHKSHKEEIKRLRERVLMLENTLKEKEERIRGLELLEDIIEHAGEEVYLVRPDGRLVFVNEAVARGLGYTKDELLKIGVGGIDPIYGPKFIQHFNELKRDNLPPFETTHITKDGKRIPKEMRSVYLRIGENEYVCGFGHDITERKKTEEELFTAYREWEYIFQAIGHPMLILDGEHTILDANKAVVDATGMARESLIGRKCYHIFHSVTKDTPPPGCPYEFMLKSRRFETCEMKVEVLDRVFMVSCTPVLKNDGTLDKVIHALTDITVLEEAITSLKKSESSYREVIERSPDAIIIHDGERFVYANHRALELYGVDNQKDLIGKNIFDYLHPDDKETIKESVRDILGKEIITPIREFRIKRSDGREIYIQSTASHIYYEGKKAVQVIMRDVTEYKKMEKALIESEARYRNIFENATEGIFQTTPEGRYLDANPAFVRMFGFSSLDEMKEEVKDIGRQLYVNPEDRERFKKELADKGYVRDFEVQVKRKDGYPFWISINARVVYDDKGNIMYYEGTDFDITRRKQAEDALRASEEKYRSILEHSIEGFFQTTPEGRFLTANPALASIFGYSSPEELINEVMDLRKLYVQPEDRERLKKIFERQGYVSGFEVEAYRKDGKKIWISMTARAIKDENGKVLYYEGTTEDITQRKHAELALRASEKKFIAAFQSNPNLMAISTIKDGLYIDVNEAFCKALGYSRYEVIGKTSIQLNIFEKKEDRDRFIEKLSKGHKVRNETANIRTRFGDVRTISFNADIIEIEGELYLLSSGEDITERIRVERALRDSEERYRVAIESSNDGIAIIKGNYHLFVNRRLVEIFGYDSPEDIVGKPVTYLVHHEDKAMVDGINRKRQEGANVPSRYEFKGVKKNGEIVFIEVSASPIFFYGERMALAFLRDVSDRKRLEAQLMQAQKMEAIGQLAGGVAHDFNNILTAIIGYASLMEMRLKDGDPLKTYTQHILSSAHRAAQLTQGLLAFSRKQIINLKPVNISEVVSNLRNILSRVIGEDIDFSISIKEPVLIAMADSVQIEQVLMNLATNARDAMPKGGRLTIETARIEVDEDFIKTHQFGKIGTYALIKVEDTGTGIDEDIKDRIFNPFFTTKEVGQGTGLGLSIVYGIIKQHNGYIIVDSELGKGSVFKIFLPLLETEYKKLKKDEEKKGEFHSGGGEAILLCEDDEIVRQLTKEVLIQAGYYVIEAKDGEEALEQFQRYRDMIDLLILDVVMPKKSGIEVFEEIKKIKPDADVLFMSGYPKEVMERRGVPYKGLHIVSKPVEPTNLLKMVRELIDKPDS